MRASIAYTPLVPWLLLLASCTSPPKPPTVDEATRRPVNSALAVELQDCRSDLQNTRIVASESSRIEASTAAALNRLTLREQMAASFAAAASAPVVANSDIKVSLANRVFTVRFDFGSTRLAVPAEIAVPLIEDARAAPLILLRGRTDGTTDSPAEGHVAKGRADAVRDYLIAAGVEPDRIRATYQPAGDYAADNSNSSGRDMNRRVEIEVYRAQPVAIGNPNVAQP